MRESAEVEKVYTSKEFISDTDSSSDEENSERAPSCSESMESGEVRSVWKEPKIGRKLAKEVLESRSQKCRENRENFSTSGRFHLLKCLYESVIMENGEFRQKSFDWKLFNARCQKSEIGIELPTKRDVLRRYQTQYLTSQKNFFRYLEPAPTLTDKLTFIYEALARYSMLNINWRKTTAIYLRPALLFTVIYEHYSSRYATWKVPEELKKYEKMVNLEKIETRVESAIIEKEKRKRDSESPRFAIRTKKIKREGSEARRSVLGVRMELDESVELSSIHHESSFISVTVTPREIASLEISDITESSVLLQPSSTSEMLLDETILAGGGRPILEQTEKSFELNRSILAVEHDPMDSLILPEIDEKAAKKKKEAEKKPFQLSESGDVWSQLLNF